MQQLPEHTQPNTVSKRDFLHAFAALALTYVVFALVLNSVGTVIERATLSFGVTFEAASTLEAFKDLPIAAISLLLASYLPRFGYKRAILLGLALVVAGSLLMTLGESFWTARLFFLLSGLGFGLAKVAVYASIGLLAGSTQRHASILNILEGVFMIGVLSGYFLFASFIDDADEASLNWLGAYWVLLLLAGIAALVVATAPLAGPAAAKPVAAAKGGAMARPSFWAERLAEFTAMLRLALYPLTLVFIASIFLYVLIEQGVGTWLPTFNREVLSLSSKMSVQAASIFAAGLAIGRLSAGVILRVIRWDILLVLCLVAMAVLILLVLPLAANIGADRVISWADAPLAAYIFPLIGLFMAPIYPALNSFILSSLPTERQAAMTGLIVVFSALGGTTGSFLTGSVFGALGGQTAFYLTLLPIGLILVTLTPMRRLPSPKSAAAD